MGRGAEMPALVCLFAAGPVAEHKCTIKGLWGPCILHPSTVQRFIVGLAKPAVLFLVSSVFQISSPFSAAQDSIVQSNRATIPLFVE